jgi:hypothetical protein
MNIDFAGSEAIPGMGSGCLVSASSGRPFLGGPCTSSGQITGRYGAEVKLLGCTFSGGPIENIDFVGDIIDITDPYSPSPATATCGYNDIQLMTLADHALEADPEAKYLMVICGDTTISYDSPISCLGGAKAHLVWVLYTTQDASQCPDNDC